MRSVMSQINEYDDNDDDIRGGERGASWITLVKFEFKFKFSFTSKCYFGYRERKKWCLRFSRET